MNTNREEVLFALALGKPADKLPAFLDAMCEGSAALCEWLEALLAAHENTNSFPKLNRLHLPSFPKIFRFGERFFFEQATDLQTDCLFQCARLDFLKNPLLFEKVSKVASTMTFFAHGFCRNYFPILKMLKSYMRFLVMGDDYNAISELLNTTKTGSSDVLGR